MQEPPLKPNDFQLDLSPIERTLVVLYIATYVEEGDTPEFYLINDYKTNTSKYYMRYAHDYERDTYQMQCLQFTKLHPEIPPQVEWQGVKFWDEATKTEVQDIVGFAKKLASEALSEIAPKENISLEKVKTFLDVANVLQS